MIRCLNGRKAVYDPTRPAAAAALAALKETAALDWGLRLIVVVGLIATNVIGAIVAFLTTWYFSLAAAAAVVTIASVLLWWTGRRGGAAEKRADAALDYAVKVRQIVFTENNAVLRALDASLFGQFGFGLHELLASERFGETITRKVLDCVDVCADNRLYPLAWDPTLGLADKYLDQLTQLVSPFVEDIGEYVLDLLAQDEANGDVAEEPRAAGAAALPVTDALLATAATVVGVVDHGHQAAGS